MGWIAMERNWVRVLHGERYARGSAQSVEGLLRINPIKTAKDYRQGSVSRNPIS
jgi:hypothetical protein